MSVKRCFVRTWILLAITMVLITSLVGCIRLAPKVTAIGPEVMPMTGKVVAIAGAVTAGYALKSNGTVWAWGANEDGELGNKSTKGSNVPVQVVGLSHIIAIAGGGNSGYALKSDGTVWAWGSNSDGQLGNNSTFTNSNGPVRVSDLTHARAVAAGDSTGYALTSDGTVWAWGDGEHGQLGTNLTDASSVPVQVSPLTDITTIAALGHSGFALKSDGTVWAWGDNKFGELGNNTIVDSHEPVQVSGLIGITAIATGIEDTDAYALRSDGTVWAWGSDKFGELGNNSTIDSRVPVQVPGLTNVTAVAAGVGAAYALRSDGTVWAWGDNSVGQLGNNSITKSLVPMKVSGLAGVAAIGGGGGPFDAYALKSDGTVWAWGWNYFTTIH